MFYAVILVCSLGETFCTEFSSKRGPFEDLWACKEEAHDLSNAVSQAFVIQGISDKFAVAGEACRVGSLKGPLLLETESTEG